MTFCFFFQAEDGIRDRDVTGVQTCALPICDQRGRAQKTRGQGQDEVEGGEPGSARLPQRRQADVEGQEEQQRGGRHHRKGDVERGRVRARYSGTQNGSPAGMNSIGTSGTNDRSQSAHSFIPSSSETTWPIRISPFGLRWPTASTACRTASHSADSPATSTWTAAD